MTMGANANMRYAAFICLVWVVTADGYAQQQRPAAHSYHVVHGWPVLPENEILDEVSAVAVDSHEHVFVLTRGGRKWPDKGPLDTTAIEKATVSIFDGRSGRMVSQWGRNLFALPHSITVDEQDNVWITDVAWHQVFKFTHDGKLLLTLGQRSVAGQDVKHFNQPSDVAVTHEGSVYVSDGYGNNRIIEFNQDGRFAREWGRKGSAAGELDLPHAIAVDERGRVYVVDRNNARIQVFTAQGAFIAQWPAKEFSAPQDIKVARGGQVFIASAGKAGPVDRAGIFVLDARGRLSEKVGRFGNYDGQFYDLHWLAISRSGALYTADFEGRRVQKFVR